MAIQLKTRDDDDEAVDGLTGVDDAVRIDGSFGFSGDGAGDDPDGDSKFRGGLGDGTVDISKINDLPTYTGPTYMGNTKHGVNASNKTSSIILKVIGIILALAAVFAIYKGVDYMVGSGGEDITAKLTMSEDELAKDLDISFEQNDSFANKIPQYSNGKVTVRSGGGLDIVYINGKQVGINTTERKYSFFGIGINDPEYKAVENMTYNYEDSFSVINDMMNENSKNYYYYNKKNNDCLVTIVSDRTNRIVSLTYYTDLNKISEALSGLDD